MAKPKTFEVKSLSANTAELRIIGEILGWEEYSESVRMALKSLIDSGATKIQVYINSGGGSVFQANEIYNYLKDLSVDTEARLGALCASAATVIALGCDKVVMASNGMFMIHKPSVLTQGNEDDLESSLQLLRNVQTSFLKLYAQKTGKTEKQIQAIWGKDYWMNAQQAKEEGFVDEVAGEESISADDAKAVIKMMNVPEGVLKLAANAGNTSQKDEQTKTNMKEIAKKLGLPEDATIEQINAKIEELNKNKPAAPAAPAAAAPAATATANEKLTASVIALGKKSGFVTDKNEASFTKLATADPDAAMELINNTEAGAVVSAQANLVDALKALKDGETKNDGAPKTWDEYQAKNPAALMKMKTEKPEDFKKLYKEKYGVNPQL